MGLLEIDGLLLRAERGEDWRGQRVLCGDKVSRRLRRSLRVDGGYLVILRFRLGLRCRRYAKCGAGQRARLSFVTLRCVIQSEDHPDAVVQLCPLVSRTAARMESTSVGFTGTTNDLIAEFDDITGVKSVRLERHEADVVDGGAVHAAAVDDADALTLGLEGVGSELGVCARDDRAVEEGVEGMRPTILALRFGRTPDHDRLTRIYDQLALLKGGVSTKWLANECYINRPST